MSLPSISLSCFAIDSSPIISAYQSVGQAFNHIWKIAPQVPHYLYQVILSIQRALSHYFSFDIADDSFSRTFSSQSLLSTHKKKESLLEAIKLNKRESDPLNDMELLRIQIEEICPQIIQAHQGFNVNEVEACVFEQIDKILQSIQDWLKKIREKKSISWEIYLDVIEKLDQEGDALRKYASNLENTLGHQIVQKVITSLGERREEIEKISWSLRKD